MLYTCFTPGSRKRRFKLWLCTRDFNILRIIEMFMCLMPHTSWKLVLRLTISSVTTPVRKSTVTALNKSLHMLQDGPWWCSARSLRPVFTSCWFSGHFPLVLSPASKLFRFTSNDWFGWIRTDNVKTLQNLSCCFCQHHILQGNQCHWQPCRPTPWHYQHHEATSSGTGFFPSLWLMLIFVSSVYRMLFQNWKAFSRLVTLIWPSCF